LSTLRIADEAQNEIYLRAQDAFPFAVTSYLKLLMKAHTPRKHGRGIFCIAATKVVRISLIEDFKASTARKRFKLVFLCH